MSKDQEYMLEITIIKVDGSNMDEWKKVKALTESIQVETLEHDLKEVSSNIREAINEAT